MPNNIFVGPNSLIATQDATFAAIGLTSADTEIVYQIGNSLKSWKPGRPINGIVGIEKDKGYYFIAKTALDLTAYFEPNYFAEEIHADPAVFQGKNFPTPGLSDPKVGTAGNPLTIKPGLLGGGNGTPGPAIDDAGAPAADKVWSSLKTKTYADSLPGGGMVVENADTYAEINSGDNTARLVEVEADETHGNEPAVYYYMPGNPGKLIFLGSGVEDLPETTPAAPTGGTVNDSLNEYDWVNNPLFPAASDYEQTLDGGTTVTTAQSKPIAIGNIAKAPGQVGIRVKSINGNPPSAWLFNTQAFTVAAAGGTVEKAYHLNFLNQYRAAGEYPGVFGINDVGGNSVAQGTVNVSGITDITGAGPTLTLTMTEPGIGTGNSPNGGLDPSSDSVYCLESLAGFNWAFVDGGGIKIAGLVANRKHRAYCHFNSVSWENKIVSFLANGVVSGNVTTGDNKGTCAGAPLEDGALLMVEFNTNALGEAILAFYIESNLSGPEYVPLCSIYLQRFTA